MSTVRVKVPMPGPSTKRPPGGPPPLQPDGAPTKQMAALIPPPSHMGVKQPPANPGSLEMSPSSSRAGGRLPPPSVVNVKVPAGSRETAMLGAYIPSAANTSVDENVALGADDAHDTTSDPRLLSSQSVSPYPERQGTAVKVRSSPGIGTGRAALSHSRSPPPRGGGDTLHPLHNRHTEDDESDIDEQFMRSGSLYRPTADSDARVQRRQPSRGGSQRVASPSQSRSPSGLRSQAHFDRYDRAPEDRIPEERFGFGAGEDDMVHPFSRHDTVVRGTFVIEGCNFARFESSARRPDDRRRFTTAIRDDMIACIGQGVRRHDIMLRAAPGPIRGVVLEYDREVTDTPKLVNADWGIEFEYAIRVRSDVAQKRVGMLLFTAYTDQGGLDVQESRHAWVTYVDPTADPAAIYTHTTHDARNQALGC